MMMSDFNHFPVTAASLPSFQAAFAGANGGCSPPPQPSQPPQPQSSFLDFGENFGSFSDFSKGEPDSDYEYDIHSDCSSNGKFRISGQKLFPKSLLGSIRLR